MEHQFYSQGALPDGFTPLLTPGPGTVSDRLREQMQRLDDRRQMCRPRDNLLPRELASRPPPHSLTEAPLGELSSRPESIGQSYDAARRHFSQLSPGRAFGFSQDGRFAKFGRKFWEHVSDIYDWERAICQDPQFGLGIREMATGIRLIIGDDLADHIATPHEYLVEGGSCRLSQDQRMALTQYKYLVMIYQGPIRSGQHDFVILLLLMPDQYVLTFSAHNGTEYSKKELHVQALNALDKMLRNSDLPAIQWFRTGEMGHMMKVTPDSRHWANPYLTLEAFRIFVREARRQEHEYEDWPFSEQYLSFPVSERTGEKARDMWLGNLRGALGSQESQPLRSDVVQAPGLVSSPGTWQPTSTINSPVAQASPSSTGRLSATQDGFPWGMGSTVNSPVAQASPKSTGGLSATQDGFPWGIGSTVNSPLAQTSPNFARGVSSTQDGFPWGMRSPSNTWEQYGSGGVNPSQPGLGNGSVSGSPGGWSTVNSPLAQSSPRFTGGVSATQDGFPWGMRSPSNTWGQYGSGGVNPSQPRLGNDSVSGSPAGLGLPDHNYGHQSPNRI